MSCSASTKVLRALPDQAIRVCHLAGGVEQALRQPPARCHGQGRRVIRPRCMFGTTGAIVSRVYRRSLASAAHCLRETKPTVRKYERKLDMRADLLELTSQPQGACPIVAQHHCYAQMTAGVNVGFTCYACRASQLGGAPCA